ncbi:MAG: PAS domain S-box protein [Cellvibrio sp.]
MPLIRDNQTPPQVHYWQPKQYLLISIMAPMVLFITLVFATELIDNQEHLHEETLLQESLTDKTNQIRTLLEYELNSTLHLATSLVSYIQSKEGKIVTQEVEPWLSNLQERAHFMRTIAIAPNNTITYMYPLKGNEAAMGLYYPGNSEQWPDIQKVIYSKRPMLAGPVHLQQGGLGLIYRIPVFLNGNRDYWGLVSTVLNFDELYQLLHSRAQYLGIKIAIKDNDNGDQILFGDKDVIANSEINVNVSGRNWQLVSGSATQHPHAGFSSIRIGGWLLAAIVSLLFNSLLRSLAQQHKTRYQLYESKFRFTQAFDNAPQGMALIDRRGDLIDFNNSLCSTLGYTSAELRNQNFFALAAPDQRERLAYIVEGIYPKPGANHQYESTLIHQAGHTINVIISLAPTQPTTYESDWIIQIIDISHRIAFEHLLQEEATYNQSILNAVIDGIMIIDTNGNIRSVNPATSKIFGYAIDQFGQQHINQFVQDPESGSIMRHIRYHTDNSDLNEDINHEVLGIKSNGEYFPLEIQLSFIQRKNEKLFIAVVRDVSERKRLEHIKQEFISNISHELRTPLTSILGSLRLMQSGALGKFDEQTEKIIRIANQNSLKLEALIRDLLDMDKLLSRKMYVDSKVQAVYPIVVQAIENLSSIASQQNIKFDFPVRDQGWTANVDSIKLRHILTNLLSNAVKFSPANSCVKVNLFSVGDKLRVEIIDQGAGIPSEEQAKLFQEFYQIDRSNSRQTGGAGLGLAISKELVQLMRGTIGVFSTPGKGSCFFIELPLSH